MLNTDAKYKLKYGFPCIHISEAESSLDIREQNSIFFISRICTHILWQLKTVMCSHLLVPVDKPHTLHGGSAFRGESQTRW